MRFVRYKFELEVIEGAKCHAHKLGDRLQLPQDYGRMCPWLRDSVDGMVRALMFGGTLPWRYEGTPYEKQIDPEGVTTEFIRCPDPTEAGIVVKLTRTKVGEIEG